MSQDHEFYPTPGNLAAYLWQRLLWQVPDGDDLTQALEPSAGRGAFALAMAQTARVGNVTAIEPHVPKPRDLPDNVEWGAMALEDLHAALEGERPFDIACGNPPFSLAEAHLRILFKIVRPDGHVGFLLRSGFLGSKGRADFFHAFPPKHVYILSERPSFVWSHGCKECKHSWTTAPESPAESCPECGGVDLSTSKTDRYDYAFCVWQAGWTGTTTMSWLTQVPGKEDAK